MDSQNNVVAVLLAAVVAVLALLGLAGGVAVWQMRQSTMQARQEAAMMAMRAEQAQETAIAARQRTLAQSAAGRSSSSDSQRVKDLAAKKDSIIREQERELRTKATELTRLRKEFGEQLGVLLDELQSSEAVRQAESSGTGEELENLTGRLRETIDSELELQDEIDSLSEQLADSQSAMREAQEEMELELDAVTANADAVQQSASRALADLGIEALPGLLQQLSDENASIRLFALRTLALMRTAAAPAIDDVRSLLRDTDEQVRQQATSTLNSIAP